MPLSLPLSKSWHTYTCHKHSRCILTQIQYAMCVRLRVYVPQIHVDLSSRFVEFLQESNRRPGDWQSHALTNWTSFTLTYACHKHSRCILTPIQCDMCIRVCVCVCMRAGASESSPILQVRCWRAFWLATGFFLSLPPSLPFYKNTTHTHTSSFSLSCSF